MNTEQHLNYYLDLIPQDYQTIYGPLFDEHNEDDFFKLTFNEDKEVATSENKDCCLDTKVRSKGTLTSNLEFIFDQFKITKHIKNANKFLNKKNEDQDSEDDLNFVPVNYQRSTFLRRKRDKERFKPLQDAYPGPDFNK